MQIETRECQEVGGRIYCRSMLLACDMPCLVITTKVGHLQSAAVGGVRCEARICPNEGFPSSSVGTLDESI
jgi:hypothetical protein